MVPPVREDWDPAFGHEGLDEDEHAECEGEEGEGEVVEDGHGCGEGFFGPLVALFDDGLERCGLVL